MHIATYELTASNKYDLSTLAMECDRHRTPMNSTKKIQKVFSDPFWNGKTGQHVAWNTDRYQQAACISHSQMILTSRWAVGPVSGAAGCRILEAMQKGWKRSTWCTWKSTWKPYKGTVDKWCQVGVKLVCQEQLSNLRPGEWESILVCKEILVG